MPSAECGPTAEDLYLPIMLNGILSPASQEQFFKNWDTPDFSMVKALSEELTAEIEIESVDQHIVGEDVVKTLFEVVPPIVVEDREQPLSSFYGFDSSPSQTIADPIISSETFTVKYSEREVRNLVEKLYYFDNYLGESPGCQLRPILSSVSVTDYGSSSPTDINEELRFLFTSNTSQESQQRLSPLSNSSLKPVVELRWPMQHIDVGYLSESFSEKITIPQPLLCDSYIVRDDNHTASDECSQLSVASSSGDVMNDEIRLSILDKNNEELNSTLVTTPHMLSVFDINFKDDCLSASERVSLHNNIETSLDLMKLAKQQSSVCMMRCMHDVVIRSLPTEKEFGEPEILKNKFKIEEQEEANRKTRLERIHRKLVDDDNDEVITNNQQVQLSPVPEERNKRPLSDVDISLKRTKTISSPDRRIHRTERILQRPMTSISSMEWDMMTSVLSTPGSNSFILHGGHTGWAEYIAINVSLTLLESTDERILWLISRDNSPAVTLPQYRQFLEKTFRQQEVYCPNNPPPDGSSLLHQMDEAQRRITLSVSDCVDNLFEKDGFGTVIVLGSCDSSCRAFQKISADHPTCSLLCIADLPETISSLQRLIDSFKIETLFIKNREFSNIRPFRMDPCVNEMLAAVKSEPFTTCPEAASRVYQKVEGLLQKNQVEVVQHCISGMFFNEIFVNKTTFVVYINKKVSYNMRGPCGKSVKQLL